MHRGSPVTERMRPILEGLTVTMLSGRRRCDCRKGTRSLDSRADRPCDQGRMARQVRSAFGSGNRRRGRRRRRAALRSVRAGGGSRSRAPRSSLEASARSVDSGPGSPGLRNADRREPSLERERDEGLRRVGELVARLEREHGRDAGVDQPCRGRPSRGCRRRGRPGPGLPAAAARWRRAGRGRRRPRAKVPSTIAERNRSTAGAIRRRELVGNSRIFSSPYFSDHASSSDRQCHGIRDTVTCTSKRSNACSSARWIRLRSTFQSSGAPAGRSMISSGQRYPSRVQPISAVPSRRWQPSKPSAIGSPATSSRSSARSRHVARSTAAWTPDEGHVEVEAQAFRPRHARVADLAQQPRPIDPLRAP